MNNQQATSVANPAPADMMRAYAALGLNYPNQTNRPTLQTVSQGQLPSLAAKQKTKKQPKTRMT